MSLMATKCREKKKKHETKCCNLGIGKEGVQKEHTSSQFQQKDSIIKLVCILFIIRISRDKTGRTYLDVEKIYHLVKR